MTTRQKLIQRICYLLQQVGNGMQPRTLTLEKLGKTLIDIRSENMALSGLKWEYIDGIAQTAAGRPKSDDTKHHLNYVPIVSTGLLHPENKEEHLRAIYYPHDMSDFQGSFHKDPNPVKLIVGKEGTGKTTAGLAEALYQTMLYPNNRGVIFSLNPGVTYTQLHDMADNWEMGKPIWGVNKIKATDKTELMTLFENNSMIVNLAYGELDKVRSSTYGWFMHESAQGVTKSEHAYLLSRRNINLQHPTQNKYGFCCWYMSQSRDDIPIWLLDSLIIKGHAFRSFDKEGPRKQDLVIDVDGFSNKLDKLLEGEDVNDEDVYKEKDIPF